MLSNHEIVDIYLKNKLIEKCVECQFSKKKEGRRNQEDFFQDLVLILLEYDNEKMNDAHYSNHMNALITKIIQNNIFSKTSPYWKKYEKWSMIETDEIKTEMDTPDE